MVTSTHLIPASRRFTPNVGQGDSLSIRLQSGEIYIIDSNIQYGADPPVLTQLQKWVAESRRDGARKYDIDLLCLTHPDADHYRGMTRIIDWAYDHDGKIKTS